MSSNWVIGIKFANGDSRVNGLPCIVGRSPAKELLKGKDSTWSAVSVDHKYLSRHHTEISVECGGGADDDATPPEDAPDGPDAFSQVPKLHIKQFGKNPTFFGDSAVTVSQGATQSSSLLNETGTRIFFPAELQLPEFHVKPSHKAAPEVSKPQSFSLVMSAPDAADDDVVSTDPPASHKFALLEKAMSVMGNAPPAPQLPPPTVPDASIAPVVPQSNIASPPVSTATGFLIGKGWGALSAGTPTAGVQASTPTPVATPVAHVATPPHNVTPSPKATAHHGTPKMGFWEWKSHMEGDDAVPTSWKRYVKAQADVLEAAFRDNGGANPTLNLDATYAVCFDDKEHGMVQYRRDDPSRWRPIRRRGGDQIQRPNRKRIECIPQDGGAVQPKKKKKRRTGDSDSDSWDGEDSYEDDSWIVDSDSDESFTDSSSDDESLASESSSDPGEKRRRKAKKNANKHK